MPYAPHSGRELPHGADIRWYAVVLVVTLDNTSDPLVLLGHSPVSTLLALFLDGGEFGSPLLPRGSALKLELALPADAGNVREPEKVERLGLW